MTESPPKLLTISLYILILYHGLTILTSLLMIVLSSLDFLSNPEQNVSDALFFIISLAEFLFSTYVIWATLTNLKYLKTQTGNFDVLPYCIAVAISLISLIPVLMIFGLVGAFVSLIYFALLVIVIFYEAISVTQEYKKRFLMILIGMIVLNSIPSIFGLLGIVGFIFLQMSLTNQKLTASIAEQGLPAQYLVTSFSTFELVLFGLSILSYIVILIFAIINYSRFKNSKAISMIPYYLGLAFSTYGVLSGLYYFTMSSILIQGAILAFYVYAFLQARKLQEAQASPLEDNSSVL